MRRYPQDATRAVRHAVLYATRPFRAPAFVQPKLPGPILWAGLLALVLTAGVTTPNRARELPEHTRCSTWQLRQTIGDEIWTTAGTRDGQDGANRGGAPCAGTPVGPPASPGVGDSWDWYIWSLNGFPTATLQSCTVRGMGDHCYVVVEDSQWNVNIDQTQVDAIVDAFENSSIGSFPSQGIWDLNNLHFGDAPDNLDQDPRVYILYYDFDVPSDGFFWVFDQECDDTAMFHSNECDVVYMNCSDFDPAGDYLLAVLAHEFEHLIHYNYDVNESSWVDEGMAELAMWLYGRPDNIVSFNTFPDRDLTTFSGNFYDYVKTYLWSLYFYERYGGQPTVRALIEEPGNSITGFENVLDDFAYAENFEDVFSDWVVANYVDDVTIGDGRYGYLGDTLPPFSPFTIQSTYPVGPNNATVSHWAADYARFLSGSSPRMTFDGSDNNQYAVRAILLDDTSPTQIVDMSLDAAQAGTLDLPQVGSSHDEVVMVYAGRSSLGTLTYAWGAEANPADVPQLGGAGDPHVASLRAVDSVSDQPTFEYAIPATLRGESLTLDVFDVTGRHVTRLLETSAEPGTHRTAWKLEEGASRVSPGVYFSAMTVGSERFLERVTVVR